MRQINISKIDKNFIFSLQINEKSISPGDVRDFLSEYCKLKLEAMGEADEEVPFTAMEEPGVDDEDLPSTSTDEKKLVPPHFQAVITVRLLAILSRLN